jgi:hypothetical protein
MASNNGKPFEHLLETIWKSYRVRGAAKIEKTDPTHRIIKNQVRFIANPWADYAGVFGDRCTIIEAKSHRAQRLPWRRSGGITHKQADALLDWHQHGALVTILWGREHGGNIELLVATPAVMAKADREKWKSIHFTECTPVPSNGTNLLEEIAALCEPTLGQSSTVNSGGTDTFTFS